MSPEQGTIVSTFYGTIGSMCFLLGPMGVKFEVTTAFWHLSEAFCVCGILINVMHVIRFEIVKNAN